MRDLRGLPIVHINSASRGGGVAELLRSQVPLERALGLDSRWYTISAPKSFFAITKKLHNLLQGAPGKLTSQEERYYKEIGEMLGGQFLSIATSFKQGIVVVHDPQPAHVLTTIPKHLRSVWRLHIDLSHANLWSTKMLQGYARYANSIVVSNGAFIQAFRGREVIIKPAIDPFVPKNRPMSIARARLVLRTVGIHDDRPLMVQVSRFDVWKDPVGVIRAYYQAKKNEPQLQLVLAGLMTAQDDPEAFNILTKVSKYALGDNDIFLFSDPKQLGTISNDEFVNALHTLATVIVQKSTREGFGLTITEAMWKGKPVIVAPSAGALSQIRDGKDGFIVSGSRDMAAQVTVLLKNARLRERLGSQARKNVEKGFLFPRYVLDCVRLYNRIV